MTLVLQDVALIRVTWLPALIFFLNSYFGVSFCFADDPVQFARDIKPVLSDRCYKCHGPDARNNESDLRLDQQSSIQSVINLDNVPASELLERLTTDDPDLKMPPPDSNLRVSSSEIEMIKRWLSAGAKWEGHWAFEAPVQHPLPIVENQAWNQNVIDRFVYQSMVEHGLKPNPRADRESLIRRLTFDITGLPPTIEEIDSFINDKSANAYETLVDRLLATSAYGERMASMWLDVARYSDTYGYQVDRDRRVWPWRDWVINAFNRNLSYDQFVTEQLAGDLIPNANDQQILATTFNRLHPQKVEGGSVPEEFRVEYVADRTQTFATAFLGLTLECARCHDHKYDPISQKEYYQLFSYFNNIDEAGLYSFFTNSVPTPTLLLLDEKQKFQLKKLKHAMELDSVKYKIYETKPVEINQIRQWIAKEQKSRKKHSFDQWPGQVEYAKFDDYTKGENYSVKGKKDYALKLSGDDQYKMQSGDFRRWQPFSFSLWLKNPRASERAVIFHRSRAWTDAGSRGYQLLLENGKLSFSLIHFWPGNAIRVVAEKPFAINQWTHVVISYDGSSRAGGIRIFVDGDPIKLRVVRDQLTKQITGGGNNNILVGARFRDRGFAEGEIDEFRVFNRQLSEIDAYCLFHEHTFHDLIGTEPLDLKTLGDPLLAEHFRLSADENAILLRDELKKRRQEFAEFQDRATEIMVMREMKNPRTAYLLNRGAYDSRGKVVQSGTPAVLNRMPEGAEKNRLGMTKWLLHKENPLTARVAVNRFWQLIFGEGLVATPEDFGNQGNPPSHPELLDNLAIDFRDEGWDIKRLIKMMVMSETYRQSSQMNSVHVQVDPQNRWLARASRHRLTAEMIRDNALQVSGLLVNRIGGAPVRPYEVVVSFKPVGHDKGEGLYRRSLYTYWKRTGPAPVMMALDASKRDVCRVKRERTSSSLQALVLLNDPQMIEASRALALKVIKSQSEHQESIAVLFRTLTSRNPDSRELTRLTKLYSEQEKHFDERMDLARAYLSIGELKTPDEKKTSQLAAMSIVAMTIMNHHDCVHRR